MKHVIDITNMDWPHAARGRALRRRRKPTIWPRPHRKLGPFKKLATASPYAKKQRDAKRCRKVPRLSMREVVTRQVANRYHPTSDHRLMG